MVGWVAERVCGRPGWAIAVWVGVTAVVTVLGLPASRVAEGEPRAFLPDSEPYALALAVEREFFPAIAARSRTVIIFERKSGLTAADHAFIADVADRLAAYGGTDAAGARSGDAGVSGLGGVKPGQWRVLSPEAQPFLRSRLLSPDGQAAMIVVSTDTNWVTRAGKQEVEAMAGMVGATSGPDGLTVEITGQGGLGRDLGAAADRALARTTWVTVSVVLVILLVVYRAPLAALVPLVSIGLTVYVTMRVLDIVSLAGWSVGSMEKTFAVVLIYGSGTDFAMFWIARYREQVGVGGDRRRGAMTATVAVGPAILASAGTTIAGLSMLTLADFLPSANAGRVLAIALGLSLLSALTLIPAVARLMGKWLFWPGVGERAGGTGGSRLWRAVAGRVVAHPVVAVVGTLAVLSWPFFSGIGMTYRYDGLGVAPAGSSTARGQAIAARHFSAAQLYSWSCLIRSSEPLTLDTAERVSDALAGTPGVADVWSLADALGRKTEVHLPKALLRAQGRPHYLSSDGRCMRFEVLQDAAPYSNAAMRSFREAAAAARATLPESGCELYAAGMTPYIVNIQTVTERDHVRVTTAVAAVILLILVVWIRRLMLPVVMLATTLVVYHVTLGVSQWVFGTFFGIDGIDWKVRLILFVILVAVGQDFNIFLVSRVLQEDGGCEASEAVWRGVVQTGPVISSCGLIMAATFGSLTVVPLSLYRQLGFAFSLGILLFTFVIRPIVVPGMYLILGMKRVKKVDSAVVLS